MTRRLTQAQKAKLELTMTLTEYEKRNGFKHELGHVREIGMQINQLEDKATGSRPFREPEREAIREFRNALEKLRGEIVTTMNMARQ
jgi:hypothetical protein